VCVCVCVCVYVRERERERERERARVCTRGIWGDKRDGEPGEKEEKRGINKSESRGRERKRDRGSIWRNECQGETVQTHQMVTIATTSPVSLFLSLSVSRSLPSCFVAALSLWRETNGWERQLFYILVQWHRKASWPTLHTCVPTCVHSVWCYSLLSACVVDSWFPKNAPCQLVQFFFFPPQKLMYV